MVAFGIALMFGDERLRLDALGTHLVENNIGIARQTSFDPRWERILTTYCHAEMRKLLAVKYGIIIHVQNRLNDGGCKIENDPHKNDKSEDTIEKPKNWNINELIQLFHCMCHSDCRGALMKDIKKLRDELFSLSKVTDLREYDTNETANCGILARLISFKK